MRVLVTGGCGFVGVNLIARMNQLGGYQVRVLDNEVLGKRQDLAGLEAEFVSGDIRDAEIVGKAMEGIDAVVHLAADTRVMDSIENPRFNMDVNVLGSMNVLEAMRNSKARILVNASTGGAIVGEVEPPVHEEMVPRPISPYGASKLAVEGYCSAYNGSYGIRSLSLRFSNVYGPRSFHKGSVVAAFYKRLLEDKQITVYGDGTQVRDFVFVEDLADGIIAGLKSDASGAIQLGSGRPTTVNELLDTMRSVVAPRELKVEYLPARAGEIYATYCDVSKARDDLGFEVRTSLADGLAQTWAWFNR